MNNQEKLVDTPKEAIECIEKNRPIGGYQMLNEALDIAIAALKKQIPQKPVYESNEGIRYTDSYKCPSCGGRFTGTGIADYCYHCGQVLDWGCVQGKKGGRS